MLRLIRGRAGSGKTAQIMQEIKARADAGQGRNYLIVPEQYSHEAERELARVCGDKLSLYAEVLSFTRLARNVAVETGGSARTYVDEGGRLLQLTLALESVGSELQLYRGAERVPEQMEQILVTLDELRREKIPAEELRRAAEEAPAGLRQKLLDLSLLREALDAVEESTGADSSTRLDVLAESVGKSEQLRGAKIFIDGFTDFTAQERAVIRALWHVADVTVLLTCGEWETNTQDGSGEVFALAEKTGQQLLRDYKEDFGVDVRLDKALTTEKTGPLAEVEKNLFGWKASAADPGSAVRLVSASSPAAECELAAAEILRLVRSENCRWRDIAVAIRGFEDYRPLLENTFRRYGVPLYLSAKTDILLRPLPTLCSAAYDALADGWSYESMFTYLKTGLTGLTREETDELENYVLLWSLRGSDWTREKPWGQHPERLDARFKPEDYVILERLDALRRRVAAPLQLLKLASDAADTALGQCRALADFFEVLDLPGRLSERADALEAAGEQQTASEYRQLWEKMLQALEQCAAVLGETPMDRETFARLFKRMLSCYDVGTIPVSLDRVTAGDFNRMRRRNLRYLLVLGASEDRLPAVSSGSGVFTEQDRTALQDLKVPLPEAQDSLSREFGLIYNVFTLPSQGLWVSFPRRDVSGGEVEPSFVAERLKKLFHMEPEEGNVRSARLTARETALDLACAADREAEALFAADEDVCREIAAVRQNAQRKQGNLSGSSVKALYRESIRLSPSKVDTFNNCRFRYFMQYGLDAKPRRPAAMSPPELGTFLHYLLENVARDASALGGFAQLSAEKVAELTNTYIETYVHEILGNFEEKTPRFKYLFYRLTEEARRVVADTARELADSDFKPLAFELDFSKTEDLRPVDIGEGEGYFAGIADRVDGWEQDGKLYLRVVDYKSGSKKFSYSDVWIGLGMQMLLYLFALEKEGSAHFGGKEIVPAGVMYVPAKSPILSAESDLSDEELQKRKAKDLRRSGVVLDNDTVLHAMEKSEEPEYLPVKYKDGVYSGDYVIRRSQLEMLRQHVEQRLQQVAESIKDGSIDVQPRYHGEQDNACQYCEFAAACRFDGRSEGWKYQSGCKAEQFWERLAEENAEEEGNA